MSKRRYKEYLRDDTADVPRTSRWRSEKCCESDTDSEPNYNITVATEYPSRSNNDDQDEPTTTNADFVFSEYLSDQGTGGSHTWNDVSTDDSDHSFQEGSCTFEWSDFSDKSSDMSDGWSDHSDDPNSCTGFNEDQHYGYVNGELS